METEKSLGVGMMGMEVHHGLHTAAWQEEGYYRERNKAAQSIRKQTNKKNVSSD